jgi:glyoxylase-like metal-dependent hydrolase (beta-lactamase superfamily II)
MKVEYFFDKDTSTMTYLVIDENSNDAVVIDPVWNFDAPSGKVSEESVKLLVSKILQTKVTVRAILETHAHADHLSGAVKLREALSSASIDSTQRIPICIGRYISVVQKTFFELFNIAQDARAADYFDLLLDEGEETAFGTIKVKTISTPGHTPACSSYLIGKNIFVGDAIFMPDGGTGRCDFPGGSAEVLYNSIHEKLYAYSDDHLVYVGHDYQPGGRELRFVGTLGEQKRTNIHIKTETTKDEFVVFRKKRDATLSAPKLLLPSLQVNIRGGRLPEVEYNGVSYLKLPVRG